MTDIKQALAALKRIESSLPKHGQYQSGWMTKSDVEAIKAYIEREQWWRCIKTDPPKEGDVILLYTPRPDGGTFENFTYDKSKIDFIKNAGCIMPTYWMPLPPTPAGQEGKND